MGVALCCGWCCGAGVRGGKMLCPISRSGGAVSLHVMGWIDHGHCVHLCAITTYVIASAFLVGSDLLEVVCRCAELFATALGGVGGGCAGVL